MRSYLRRHILGFSLYGVFVLIFMLVFLLGGVDFFYVLYPSLLCIVTAACVMAADFLRYRKRQQALVRMRTAIIAGLEGLPEPRDEQETNYRALIEILFDEKCRLENEFVGKNREQRDYYAMWAHQIKTPIAAMRLLLDTDKTLPQSRELSEQLFSIEQYVEMALQYVRTDEASSDLVIRTVSVDKLVRGAIRKFSRSFIRRKITLSYEGTELTALSDEKWLSFVIEQVISNALKYTQSGGVVRIFTENDNLIIRDSGIGIRAEDLPRICEKGFTGYNGRADRKSTGIGLYLCKRVLTRLSHTIEVASETGKGTTVTINLYRAEQLED